jgi:Cu/Ag efflux protein CusF
MITKLSRNLLISLAAAALVACTSLAPTVAEEGAAVPLGIDLGGSGSVVATAWPATSEPAHSEPRGQMQMAHEGLNDAHGTGTVNAVDPAQHKVNVSHAPIPEIGWPAMTKEFPVAPAVDLETVKPGARVNFTIEQQPGGMYEIKALAPAGGGR